MCTKGLVPGSHDVLRGIIWEVDGLGKGSTEDALNLKETG